MFTSNPSFYCYFADRCTILKDSGKILLEKSDKNKHLPITEKQVTLRLKIFL